MNTHSWIKRTAALLGVAMAGSALVGQNAEAGGTATSTFVVSANVTAACTMTTAPLNFGNYVTGSALPVTSNTSFTVNCPGSSVASPTVVNLALTTGTTYSMASGANALPYALCNDAACAGAYSATATGGVGPGGVANAGTFNQSLTAASAPVQIYGSIAAGLTPPLGAYSQTVTALLSF